MKENELLKEILLALSSRQYRLFRNSVGMGYVGQVVDEVMSGSWTRAIQDGAEVYTHREVKKYVTLANARPIRFGLVPGSSDLIGWHKVIVTPEMVGHHVAVFTAIEAKTKGMSLTGEQRNFLQQVKRAGGEAYLARIGENGLSMEDVE